MIIFYQVIDFVKVLGIEIFTLNAEVSFDRFGQEFHFIGICLGDFVIVAQSWIGALTLRLEEVLDFAPKLAWIGL